MGSTDSTKIVYLTLQVCRRSHGDMRIIEQLPLDDPRTHSAATSMLVTGGYHKCEIFLSDLRGGLVSTAEKTFHVDKL